MNHSNLNNTLNIDNLRKFAKDCQLPSEFYKSKFEKQIYFDTSSVIDLLLGLHGLLQRHQLDEKRYFSPSTLVNALAYNNWLGKIYTLPPHTDELIKKLRFSTRVFGDTTPIAIQRAERQFWGDLKLKIFDSRFDPQQVAANQDWIATLKGEYIDLFKGAYLIGGEGFWKNRYRHLVKEKGVLQFSADKDYFYQTGDLIKKPLFNELKDLFEQQDSDKTSNNYTDALALTLLHERLVKAHVTKDENGKFIIPLFFSDQQRILDAVKVMSNKKDENGHPYFTFMGSLGNYCIVRDANFFIIDGVYKGMQANDPQIDLKEYLDKLKRPLADINTSILGERSKMNREERNLVSDIKTHSIDTVIIDFFSRWWKTTGFKNTRRILEIPQLSNEKVDELQAEVNQYIEEERKRLKEQFGEHERRAELLQKTLNYLAVLPQIITRQFQTKGQNMDAYLEFGPRFYYDENVCATVQQLYEKIFVTYNYAQNSHLKGNPAFEKYQLEIINDLLCGIYDSAEDEAHYHALLNRLAKSIAILWIFFSHEPNKVELIELICQVIRKRYERRPQQMGKYPHYSFGLFHAAAVLQSRSQDELQAIEIMNCVLSKGSKDYKVWSGLSFLYCKLWRMNVGHFTFPEQILQNYKLKKREEKAYEYLAQAYKFAQKVIDWLETTDEDTHKSDARNRSYHYALNNLIFTATYLQSTTVFLSLESRVDEFVDLANRDGYWQHGNYDDTLACYNYRRAIVADNQAAFNFYLNESERYINQAIQDSKKEKKIYSNLKTKINKSRLGGFHVTPRYVESPYHPLFLA